MHQGFASWASTHAHSFIFACKHLLWRTCKQIIHYLACIVHKHAWGLLLALFNKFSNFDQTAEHDIHLGYQVRSFESECTFLCSQTELNSFHKSKTQSVWLNFLNLSVSHSCALLSFSLTTHPCLSFFLLLIIFLFSLLCGFGSSHT